MTPSAFMTDAAWLEIAEQRAKGIRAMPVIQDNPEWWVLDILDGYGSHFSSPEALSIYWALKIRQAKEEGHTSHACQFYDQEPAKKDKVVLRSGTAMLRQAASVSKGVVNQWGLVAVGLMAVRSGTKDPQMWIDAAKKANLHPGCQSQRISKKNEKQKKSRKKNCWSSGIILLHRQAQCPHPATKRKGVGNNPGPVDFFLGFPIVKLTLVLAPQHGRNAPLLLL